MTDTIAAPPPALTSLSEEERLFADSVYEFADREVRPLVREMDEHGAMNKALLPKLFDLGIMGIEIPEEYGGAGATLFHSVLAVESLSRVDPALGVLVDVQNTLVVNAVRALGQRPTSRPATCRAWRPTPSAPSACRKPARAPTPSR